MPGGASPIIAAKERQHAEKRADPTLAGILIVEDDPAVRLRVRHMNPEMINVFRVGEFVVGLDTGPRRGGAADDARHGDGQCGDADRRVGRPLALRQLRHLMAYLGLVPSEHSSGASVRRGGLTKAGNRRPAGC